MTFLSPICLMLLVMAAPRSATGEPPSADAAMTAATIDGEAIDMAAIERQVDLLARGREIDPQSLAVLQATALNQIVSRTLALRYLDRQGYGATEAEVRLAIQRLEQQLQARERSLDDYLQEMNLDRKGLERALRWQLSWSKYVEKYATDENLQRYFEQHRPHFDGTQLRVAHILLAIDDQSDAAAVTAAIDEARRLRAQIEMGATSFSEAAAQHSQAPTAAEGGDIGWIDRRQPMPEAFSRAAFDLKPGAVSEPVVTTFGVHLIQVLETRPGTRTWEAAYDDLRRAVQGFLLDWMAERERSQTDVKYTGATPYFDPETGRLVE